MFENHKLIAFDTSCDETSVAVLDGRCVLANVVASQTELHKKWGGVVPAVARRAHEENIDKAFNEALKRSGLSMEDLEFVAVTIGPGLAIDLEVGIAFAKDLAIKHNLPLVPVNHMEGHFLSSLLLNSAGKGLYEDDPEKLYPALGILTSGKHTEIVLSKNPGEYEKLGETLDDAAGEAFDKVGRMLGFGYPGGPVISHFAKEAPGKERFGLPIPMERSGDLNFSYSGLKTACLYKINELRDSGRKDKEWIHDFCKEFVEVVTQSIVIKLQTAIEQNPDVKAILAGGGVFNNEYLLRSVSRTVKDNGLQFLYPKKKYRGDNASMIAIAGLLQYNLENILSGDSIEKVDREPRLALGTPIDL